MGNTYNSHQKIGVSQCVNCNHGEPFLYTFVNDIQHMVSTDDLTTRYKATCAVFCTPPTTSDGIKMYQGAEREVLNDIRHIHAHVNMQ